MNIFVIPSWYPSEDYPLSGTMVHEQALNLCRSYSNINVGISIWGQQDERYLLWARDHFKNLAKILSQPKSKYTREVMPNLVEYYHNSFTWSRKIWGGNIKRIILANVQNLKAFEADFGPVDLLHGHLTPFTGNIIRRVAEITGIPYCVTERNGPFPCPEVVTPNGKLKKEYSLHYQTAAANIAISPEFALLMEQQGIKNITLIPNHLDSNFFKPGPPAPKIPFTFLTLAHLSPRKGIDVLLKAIALLAEKVSLDEVVFRIGGDGDKTPYKAVAERLGIEGKIMWFEETTRRQALEEYQQCHTYVLPSFSESFGTVYIEALACGKPIIATRCGGPESIVTPQNGLLVEKNDPEGLAQAMLYMMENYDKYDSKTIREDFMNRFSPQAVLPKLVQLYQEIIDKHKAQK